MTISKFKYRYAKSSEGGSHLAISSSQLKQFKPFFSASGQSRSRIDRAANKQIDALVATFDLEGFTPFCNQPDPHLRILPFLNDFLKWLFSDMTKLLSKGQQDETTLLWAKLPAWEKFTGDGVMFIWDIADDRTYRGSLEVGNIILRLQQVCANYKTEFRDKVPKAWGAQIPKTLRCGVARGQVFPVGRGNDFVGGCMNRASRLQKTRHYSFACSEIGLELNECFEEQYRSQFQQVSVDVRGIGDSEPAFVLKSEHLLA